jgi:hypothetical protein
MISALHRFAGLAHHATMTCQSIPEIPAHFLLSISRRRTTRLFGRKRRIVCGRRLDHNLSSVSGSFQAFSAPGVSSSALSSLAFNASLSRHEPQRRGPPMARESEKRGHFLYLGEDRFLRLLLQNRKRERRCWDEEAALGDAARSGLLQAAMQVGGRRAAVGRPFKGVLKNLLKNPGHAD